MLRLSLLLVAAMAFALETLGQDNGQLRPGLAKAEAEGRLEEVWAAARAKAAAGDDQAEGAFFVAEAAPEPAPEPQPEALPEPVVAAAEPVTPDLIVEPARDVVQVVTDPVFTLESFGNESVPGEEAGKAAAALVEPEAAVLPEAEVPTGTSTGTEAEAQAEAPADIWFVKADSVNVRAEPSTEAAILGKLATGEELLLVEMVDDEWSRIVIQGDGVEGYVATRFLSPVAP